MLQLFGCVLRTSLATAVVFFFVVFALGKFDSSHCLVGIPPLLSRRVLETLTYLAKNHSLVAKTLLEFRLPRPVVEGPISPDQRRGKAVMVEADGPKRWQLEGQVALALLLGLLNHPLYLRSVAHLEQVVCTSGMSL